MDKDLRNLERQAASDPLAASKLEHVKARSGLVSMKLFIWNRVDQATEAFHPQGGVIIVDESLSNARKQWVEDKNSENCGLMTEEPDATFELMYQSEKEIFTFPDTGCC